MSDVVGALRKAHAGYAALSEIAKLRGMASVDSDTCEEYCATITAALAALAWRDKPDKPGWCWCRTPGEADEVVWAFGLDAMFYNKMSDERGELWVSNAPEGTRFAPVAAPPEADA